MPIIIGEISGKMWLNGVVWTRSTLLFSIFEVNIKFMRNYIKVACGGFNDLPAVLQPDCGVTAVQKVACGASKMTI